jgi:hypothetical protein
MAARDPPAFKSPDQLRMPIHDDYPISDRFCLQPLEAKRNGCFNSQLPSYFKKNAGELQ